MLNLSSHELLCGFHISKLTPSIHHWGISSRHHCQSQLSSRQIVILGRGRRNIGVPYLQFSARVNWPLCWILKKTSCMLKFANFEFIFAIWGPKLVGRSVQGKLIKHKIGGFFLLAPLEGPSKGANSPRLNYHVLDLGKRIVQFTCSIVALAQSSGKS